MGKTELALPLRVLGQRWRRRQYHGRAAVGSADQRRLFHFPSGHLRVHAPRRGPPLRALPTPRGREKGRGPEIRRLLDEHGHVQGQADTGRSARTRTCALGDLEAASWYSVPDRAAAGRRAERLVFGFARQRAARCRGGHRSLGPATGSDWITVEEGVAEIRAAQL